MEGLARAIGAGIPVALAGATYLLAPLTLGCFGIIEQLLLSRRETPIDLAVRMCERLKNRPEAQEIVLARAHKDMRRNRVINQVRQDVALDFIASTEGLELTAWLCLRKHHLALFETLEKSNRIVRAATEEEIKRFVRVRDQISSMHWFSIADWMSVAEDEEEDGPKKKPSNRLPPWQQWMKRVMEEYPGLSKAQVEDWTLDQVRVAFTQIDKNGGRGGGQFRKRKVI